jgi:hypothetical protein
MAIRSQSTFPSRSLGADYIDDFHTSLIYKYDIRGGILQKSWKSSLGIAINPFTSSSVVSYVSLECLMKYIPFCLPRFNVLSSFWIHSLCQLIWSPHLQMRKVATKL